VTYQIPSHRIYRVTDPGSEYRLCHVEHSDDGGATWRETRNSNRLMREHYRLHGTMPPGLSSDGWPAIKSRWDVEASQASGRAQETGLAVEAM
jgi:hypothetical protein